MSNDNIEATLNKDASNSIFESNHASSTHSLKASGMVQIDNAARKGQTGANNHFRWGHKTW